ncbi:MAG: hypothetical protein L0H73_18740 [Nitrococcus sp.]|nr:hypothetical protein [Nitrococcus sp.]
MNVRIWTSTVAMGLIMMTLSAAASEPPGEIEWQSVSAEATVKAIDYKTRMVSLENEDGTTLEIKAGPAVKRLDEIKAGDSVALTYYESLAMNIVPKAEAGQMQASMTESKGRAPKTQSPAGIEVREIDAIVEITAIDKKAETVSVKGPEGNVVTVHARHPENLDKIKVGDEVYIAYTEAVAIAIEPKAKD